MSEKIRAEFELWFESSCGFSLSKDDKTTYSTPWVNDMFHAWKASRAALVVELPELKSFNASDEPDFAYEVAIDDIKCSLYEAGVAYK